MFADWLPEGREAINPQKSITFDNLYFFVLFWQVKGILVLFHILLQVVVHMFFATKSYKVNVQKKKKKDE